jgi:peptidyl-tRNA hydrolase
MSKCFIFATWCHYPEDHNMYLKQSSILQRRRWAEEWREKKAYKILVENPEGVTWET